MSLINLLYGRSSVSKSKQKILKEALKGSYNKPGIEDIEKYRKTNTGTTSVQEDVERSAGKRPESDYDKAIRERARKAMEAIRKLNK